MILLIVAAVLFGLAWLPIGIRAVYREKTPGVWLLVGPLKFTLYPKKTKKQQPQSASAEETEPEKKERGGSYTNFQSVLREVLEFLSHFRRKLRVRDLELKLTLAGDDPADLAINYGRAWAAVGSLMPQLERLFVIKKRDVEVLCDFAGDETRIYARIDATITLGRSLHLLSRHGMKILRHLFSTKNYEKAVPNYEPKTSQYAGKYHL